MKILIVSFVIILQSCANTESTYFILEGDFGKGQDGELTIYPFESVNSLEEHKAKSIKTKIENGKLFCKLNSINVKRVAILVLNGKRYKFDFFSDSAILNVELKDYKIKVNGGLKNKEYHTLKKQLNYNSYSKSKYKKDSLSKSHVAKYKADLLDFIKSSPKSIPLSYLIHDAYWGANIDTLETIIDEFSNEIYESFYLKNLITRRDIERRLSVGKEAPLFEIPINENELFKLKNLRGHYVLIDFWASWCAPCRKSIPNLKKIYAKYKEKNFRIVSISTDSDSEKWQKALIKEQMPWLQLLDTQNISGKLYNVTAIPHIVLISPDGNIIHKGHMSDQELADTIKKLNFSEKKLL